MLSSYLQDISELAGYAIANKRNLEDLTQHGFEAKTDKVWFNKIERTIIAYVNDEPTLEIIVNVLNKQRKVNVILFFENITERQQDMLEKANAIVMLVPDEDPDILFSFLLNEDQPDITAPPPIPTESISNTSESRKDMVVEQFKTIAKQIERNHIIAGAVTLLLFILIWFIFLRDNNDTPPTVDDSISAESSTNENTENIEPVSAFYIGFDFGFINPDAWGVADGGCEFIGDYASHSITTSSAATISSSDLLVLSNNGTVDVCQRFYQISFTDHVEGETVDVTVQLPDGRQETILTVEPVEIETVPGTDVKTITDLVESTL